MTPCQSMSAIGSKNSKSTSTSSWGGRVRIGRRWDRSIYPLAIPFLWFSFRHHSPVQRSSFQISSADVIHARNQLGTNNRTRIYSKYLNGFALTMPSLSRQHVSLSTLSNSLVRLSQDFPEAVSPLAQRTTPRIPTLRIQSRSRGWGRHRYCVCFLCIWTK